MIFTDIYMWQVKYKININDQKIRFNFYSWNWSIRKDDFTIYVFYIVLGLSYAIEVKPAIWDTYFLFRFILIWFNLTVAIWLQKFVI